MKNINPHSKKSPNTTDDSTVLNNFDLAFSLLRERQARSNDQSPILRTNTIRSADFASVESAIPEESPPKHQLPPSNLIEEYDVDNNINKQEGLIKLMQLVSANKRNGFLKIYVHAQKQDLKLKRFQEKRKTKIEVKCFNLWKVQMKKTHISTKINGEHLEVEEIIKKQNNEGLAIRFHDHNLMQKVFLNWRSLKKVNKRAQIRSQTPRKNKRVQSKSPINSDCHQQLSSSYRLVQQIESFDDLDLGKSRGKYSQQETELQELNYYKYKVKQRIFQKFKELLKEKNNEMQKIMQYQKGKLLRQIMFNWHQITLTQEKTFDNFSNDAQTLQSIIPPIPSKTHTPTKQYGTLKKKKSCQSDSKHLQEYTQSTITSSTQSVANKKKGNGLRQKLKGETFSLRKYL